MFTNHDRVAVFVELGTFLAQWQEGAPQNHHLNNTFLEPMKTAILRSQHENGWFSEPSVRQALVAWGTLLTKENLENWLANYAINPEQKPKNVAIIMAGNIPLVGLHDFLAVLLSGHKAIVKLSSDDKRLLPQIAQILVALHPDFEHQFAFVDRVVKPDAVIATGSNNTARYFEYYFGKYPNIIRKNRTSVAVISGRETPAQLQLLGKDLFDYFGLGCRNVSKFYIPEGYKLDTVFEAIVGYNEVANHHKYANNYDYHRAIFMLNKVPFLENGFVIFREAEDLHTPVSVIHYSYYTDEKVLRLELEMQKDALQCVVGLGDKDVPFGQSQSPKLADYADGVDTLQFLLALR